MLYVFGLVLWLVLDACLCLDGVYGGTGYLVGWLGLLFVFFVLL